MVVEREIRKLSQIPRTNLEVKKLKNNDDILPFISTYNLNNPDVFPKVREIYGNLKTSKTLEKIFA